MPRPTPTSTPRPIDHQLVYHKNRLGACRRNVPQRHAHPRQQFPRAKGLGHVIVRACVERGILDGGSKTFSSDLNGLEGHGLVLEYSEARFYGMSEEHGHVDFSASPRKPEIGERVSVIPNHVCVVTNLFNQIVGVRRGTVEAIWPVAARGALQ